MSDKYSHVHDSPSKSSEFVDMSIENGIFILRYKPLKLLDITVAKKIVEERLNFKKGIAYPSLFDITNIENTTKEARDYLANEGNTLVIASALLVSSPMLRMMANFYIKVNKPKNPTQMFTDEKLALTWLEPFKP